MENENNQLPQEEERPDTVTEETAEQPAVAEETAPAEEPAPVESKKGILLTPGKLVGLIVGVIVLVAVLVGAIVYGMGGFKQDDADETTAATEETVIPTYAADTGRDDVTHKGTYTVSDEEIVELADRVVATIGEDELTVKDLQVHYWMQVQNFMFNYSYYLSAFGLDYNQPLDTQICEVMGNGYTWQQYFLEAALYNWHNYQAMSNVSLDNGFEISGEDREYLDTLADNLEASATAQGFANAEELLAYNVGKCSSLDSYIHYETMYVQGVQYYEHEKESISTTLEDLEAYFAEHEEEYTENGVTKDGVYVDVRHILIRPEGGTTDEEGNTTYSDEEWEACRTAAQEILDQWLAGEQTEESFGELANQHSADSDGTDGGLYEDVQEGQMVPNFNDWCFDENRQVGDYDLVQTEFGYHVMYFVGSTPIWQVYAENDLVAEQADKIVSDACEAYPMEVDYSAIALGEVDIASWFEY